LNVWFGRINIIADAKLDASFALFITRPQHADSLFNPFFM